ncbi:MAG: alpha/beta hydrolase [Actinomycetota bacterium]
MPRIENDGHKIRYETAGSGPPLIMVAGITQWADQWDENGYVDRLAATYRVITADPLGHGESDKPHEPDAYRWPRVVHDVIAVLDAESIERALVWGYSMGGSIVRDVAHARPDRVAAVVTGDAGPPARGHASHPAFTPAIQSEDGLRAMWEAFDTPPDAMARGLAMNDVSALKAMWEGIGVGGPSYDRVEVPILAYYASNRQLDPWSAVFLANTGAVQHIIPDSSHFSAFARADDVLDVVEPFLALHADETASS